MAAGRPSLAAAVLALAVLAAAVGPSAAQGPLGTTEGDSPAVADSDVLEMPDGPVRLAGLDAPDLGQLCVSGFGRVFDCHRAAVLFLEAATRGNRVSCEVLGRDPTGMRVGRCAVRGLDLNAMMVRAGWAFAFRSLGHDYSIQESRAQAARSGVWSGRAEAPWIWRSRQVGLDRPRPR
jgi:endonuclease YncB( thermonuclease family)